MKKSDQPLGLVGFLFGFSIAFWTNSIAAHYATELPDTVGFDTAVWLLTLVAGLVFLADIVCIMWWYMMYIYKIQLTATLLTYALDFGVCAMFNIAGHKWTEPTEFLLAVVIASALLGWRFYNLYHSHEANDTDRRILRAALRGLIAAVAISATVLLVIVLGFPDQIKEYFEEKYLEPKVVHPVSVIALSAIGIWLTIWFRDRIRVSAQIHEVREGGPLRFVPMDLRWPVALLNDATAKHEITDETRRGLDDFRALFRGDPGELELEHDRLLSRVHSEGDLRVQSYILAIPSWTPDEEPTVQANEVNNKAFMVGVSHWLDDLVDGRGEQKLYQRIKKEKDFGLDIENAENVFRNIYTAMIFNNTSKKFYKKLLAKIMATTPIPDNRKYLFFSLNRVAVGATIFGPKLKETRREKILETHNSVLATLVLKENSDPKNVWYRDLSNLLTEMIADESGIGNILLGLTTKTVQEMAMASEGLRVCFAQSVAYSILYAPLLYFHDADGELACNEMVPIENFDVNYDSICPWLADLAALIDRADAPDDPRKDSRREQLKMAFRCFSPNLPALAKDTLAEVYDPEGLDSQDIPLKQR